MSARPLLLAGVVAALVGGAGLGLAQDQNQNENQLANTVAPAPSVAAQPGASASAPGAPPPPQSIVVPALELPPAEEAPPAPAASATNDVADDAATDAAANAIPSAPPPAPVRPRYATAVLQALDKVTAETLRFEAKINEPVRYKDLVITVHACETQAADEPYAQTAAHLDVQYQPDVLPARGQPVARQVFRGWMFGEAPGLHPFEHPIYDVWLIACKTPSAAAAPSPAGASL